MKLFYDYQIFLLQKYGGISRYYCELIKHFRLEDEIDVETFCCFSINNYYREIIGSQYLSNGKRKKGSKIINAALTILYLKTHSIDILHPTYYNPYFINTYKGKVVITVYDMIHELFPQYFGDDKMTTKNKALMLKRADHIIAISESTKHDILKLYPDISENKITVIYIASEFQMKQVEMKIENFPKKYILFVGKRKGYKNYDLFFQSIRPILKKDSSLSLVCLGGGKFTDDEHMNQRGFENQIVQMDVNDDILAYGYSHAECFVFPSLYEGFGIPTLEAFACKCPVVLSNTSSMPEVGGDAVQYMDPYDVDDMTKTIEMVLKNKELRKEMIRRGEDQIKKFDWHEIAKQTVQCYRNVLKEKN